MSISVNGVVPLLNSEHTKRNFKGVIGLTGQNLSTFGYII